VSNLYPDDLMPDEPEQSPALFTLFPGTEHHRLIVRYPYDTDARLSYQFADAAGRLASTYTGQPADDAMLLPWLYLHRHAIELSLKSSIRIAVQLRRNNGEGSDNLQPEAMAKRLRKKHGHRLKPLIDELNAHLIALQLDTVPADTMAVVELLNLADPGGMAFRYSGELPNGQDFMDFPALNKALSEAYSMVGTAEDVLDHYAEGQADWLAHKQEIEAEMRAEFEAEMRSAYGSEGW
jgi:hypothetical protein